MEKNTMDYSIIAKLAAFAIRYKSNGYLEARSSTITGLYTGAGKPYTPLTMNGLFATLPAKKTGGLTGKFIRLNSHIG
jgi:hypothetical protein